MSGTRRLPIAFVIVAAGLLFLAAALWSVGMRLARGGAAAGSPPSSAGELPLLGDVPEFALTSSDGSRFGLDDLQGAPWVVDFIFTNCAGTCPLMSAEMARLQAEIPEGSSIHLVSITVDPGRDTPEVLQEYGKRYGARPDRWTFLTGDAAGIYRLSADGFHLAAGERTEGMPDPTDGPFFHSSRMVLVDPQARIRGYYDSADAGEMDRLRGDLHLLEVSAQESAGTTPVS